MSYSNTVTKNDLKNVLNEVLPSPTMIKTKQYTSTITWASTSNPFGDVYTDIEIDGWTPINLSYLIGGSLSSFVFGSQIEIKESNGTTYAHGYFRMTGATPSSTTQNSVIWTVVYIKNAPMTLPIADYIVEQGTNANGTYRKWNSGILEQWGYTTIGSNSAASWTYPIPFYSTSIYLTATCHYLSTGTYVAPTISVQPTYTDHANIYARVSTSTVTNAHTVSCHAIGKWK